VALMGGEFLVAGVAVGCAATALTMLLMPSARRLATVLGALDEPGARKIHQVTTARTGGIAIYVAFTVVVLLGYFLEPYLATIGWMRIQFAGPVRLLREASRVDAKLLAVVVGASLTFAIGLVDDIFGSRLHVGFKAAGQLLAAVLVVSAGVRTTFLGNTWLDVVVSMLWIVGITNAFNLLDNMDGLSAGVAFVASAVFLINAWALGEFFVALILLAFMGSLMGFLFFNFHPASLFLGDCGSLFIGFVMSSLTLLERYVSHAPNGLFPVIMPLLVLALPLIDTLTVVTIRVREGRPVYVGDSRHLSHRLLALGFSQRTTALFLYLVTFCLGLGAVLLPHATTGQSFLILLQAVCFVALLLLLLFFDRARTGGNRAQAP
jgi:UDP-GlcNAc:undecaprenyl-phosphate GlcNAc-1-phosphate transferase